MSWFKKKDGATPATLPAAFAAVVDQIGKHGDAAGQAVCPYMAQMMSQLPPEQPRQPETPPQPQR